MDIEHTLPGLHNSSNDAKAEFNNCLLFIQNNSYFTNKLKHAYLHRSTSIACLSASLGEKGFFRTANILQIADVVRRVVFLLVLLCFSQWFAHFFLLKRVKCSAILYSLQPNLVSRSSRQLTV